MEGFLGVWVRTFLLCELGRALFLPKRKILSLQKKHILLLENEEDLAVVEQMRQDGSLPHG